VREINTKLFEKDYLDFLDYFSNAALQPENPVLLDTTTSAGGGGVEFNK
jgi:hypothetical protein